MGESLRQFCYDEIAITIEISIITEQFFSYQEFIIIKHLYTHIYFAGMFYRKTFECHN